MTAPLGRHLPEFLDYLEELMAYLAIHRQEAVTLYRADVERLVAEIRRLQAPTKKHK